MKTTVVNLQRKRLIQNKLVITRHDPNPIQMSESIETLLPNLRTNLEETDNIICQQMVFCAKLGKQVKTYYKMIQT